jgi:phosphatidylglycerophosphatase A
LSKSSLYLKNVATHVATLGPIGYLPYAPGTWGSAAGALLLLLVPLQPAVQLIVIIAGFIAGSIAADVAERAIGEQDSGHIIIDEVVGMAIAASFLPHTAGHLIAAFVLFRFFDILKPFPIRYVESALKGGIGIMADDVLAGMCANLVIQLWIMIV